MASSRRARSRHAGAWPLLALALACKSPAPAPAAEAGPIDARVADADDIRDAPLDGAEATLITLVRELARDLADHPRRPEALVARLGTRKPGRGHAIHVAPTDARLADVALVRGPGGALGSVVLELAQPVTLGDLRAAFGAYEADAAGRPLAVWPFAFVRAVRGPAASVSLFADAPHADPFDAQTTARITLQLGPP
jgi:hypothetical protein